MVNPQTPAPIRLCDYQEPHLAKLSQILQHNYVALDYSRTGLGKTYTASALSTSYKYPIILISTPTIFSVWKKMETEHGVVIRDMLSYDILRGIHGKKCNHPYLTRDDQDKYAPTPYLISLINQGVMFVFDEMSKLKNQDCQARRASHVIIKTIISKRSVSRVLLLSALPCDKPIHVLSLMQLLGIIYDDKFIEYDQSERIYHLRGMQEAIDWCYARNPSAIRDVVYQYPVRHKKDILNLGMELYRHAVFDNLSSCMKVNNPIDEMLDVKNGYYPIDSRNLTLLLAGKTILHKAVRYNNDLEDINSSQVNWGQITQGLELLGRGKLKMMAQMARVFLMSNPQSKGVIGVWFIDHIKWLAEVLAEYGVVTLYGGVKMSERTNVIDRFQDPDSNCRIIIINPTVGGMGISLDDRDGNHPRWMLLMPDYRLMDLVQCTGRVHRNSTRSKRDTIIRFVYAKAFKMESKILSALLRKSNAARIVVSGESGIILPDSYPVDDQIQVLPEFPFVLPVLPGGDGELEMVPMAGPTGATGYQL